MEQNIFKLKTKLKPAGDQPKAIKKLVEGLEKNYRHQTLLGVTGSGKTFTVANVIATINKPTLVIAHNKTLAAQLCNEFRELFPENAVHYFVSYYDYYQPEAYIPISDTYIGKEAMINDEIDKLRHAATTALLTRQDVIIVASVSCIYGLGAPEIYSRNILHLKVGGKISRDELMRKLINLQFSRTSADLKRSTFRLRGDNWEIMPTDREVIYNLVVKNDIIQEIYEMTEVRLPSNMTEIAPLRTLSEIFIAPAKHFIIEAPAREKAIANIKQELKERLKYFESQGKYLETERLERRTKSDLAMIKEIGYCHGIENYSRHLSGRIAGEPPATLLDYFPPLTNSGPVDFLTVIDESHIAIPQIQGMYEGDASRKQTLIEHGFRLPSAADNRPLKFKEFGERVGRIIYISATPAGYEKKLSEQIVEQINRPTGLIDPKIIILPATGQIENLIKKIQEKVEKKERVLVTTLTKRMAEDLSEYLQNLELNFHDNLTKFHGREKMLEQEKIKISYLHSDVKTLERIKILSDLRKGKIDVLVGVNLLREGLDLPEVSLVAILDADKEGFLRSETSLIQTIGRAARNVKGEVLIYADHITGSIKKAVEETERRRKLQLAYNKKHNIIPKTIVKKISDILATDLSAEVSMKAEKILNLEMKPLPKSKTAAQKMIFEKEREMKSAAQALNFELAAILRDELKILNKL